MTSIYLAGPDVFLPDALDIGRRKAELCARYGLTGLFPLDNAVALAAHDASLQIFRGNEAMMNDADAIIANLTPFRGPSADAGTVYELGYMAGRGKLVLGYSNDPATYVERVARGERIEKRDGVLIGEDGLVVEDFGLPDNLMLIHALDLHGAPLVVPKAAPADTRSNDSQPVMPGLDPGIHALLSAATSKTWMAGSSPAMTSGQVSAQSHRFDIWRDLTAFEACVKIAAERLLPVSTGR